MAPLKEIQAQIVSLQKQAAEQREREIKEPIRQIRDLMKEYGIKADDLRSIYRDKPLESGEVQFRHPQTGASWSGRGRMPQWLVGLDKEKHRV